MRIIDADALIESIKHGLWDWETINGIESRTVLEQTIQDIKNEPTIDAEPVRHGKWDDKRVAFYRKCSECGATIKNTLSHVFLDYDIRDLHYCPNCGCKMDLDEVNDE